MGLNKSIGSFNGVVSSQIDAYPAGRGKFLLSFGDGDALRAVLRESAMPVFTRQIISGI